MDIHGLSMDISGHRVFCVFALFLQWKTVPRRAFRQEQCHRCRLGKVTFVHVKLHIPLTHIEIQDIQEQQALKMGQCQSREDKFHF